MDKNNKIIKQAIIKCIFINFLMAILSVIFFFFTWSVSILFDGIYSLTMGIAIIFGFIIKFNLKEDKEKYPFGKQIFENLFVMFKLLTIILMSIGFFALAIFEMIDAIQTKNVPKQPEFWIYIVYTAIMIVLCFICWLIYHLANKKVNTSMLLEAEKKVSILDLGISSSIGISLTVSALALANHTNADLIRLLIDRSVLLLFVLATMPSLLKQFFKSLVILAGKRTNDALENKLISVLNDKENFVQSIYIRNVGSDNEVYIEVKIDNLKNWNDEFKLKNEKTIQQIIGTKIFVYYFIV